MELFQIFPSYTRDLLHARRLNTIREAGIPRNTFLYRIKRIAELLDMDLDDPDVRLVLMVSYAVLDWEP